MKLPANGYAAQYRICKVLMSRAGLTMNISGKLTYRLYKPETAALYPAVFSVGCIQYSKDIETNVRIW